MRRLRQMIPSSACLGCNVCCRYLERDTIYVPHILSEEVKEINSQEGALTYVGKRPDLKAPPIPYKDIYICRFFAPEKNACQIYNSRPLDCQLYPFMVTYDEDFKSIILALDRKCPYMKERLDSKEMKEYVDYLVDIFETEEVIDSINKNKNFINSAQDDAIYLKRLEGLSRRVSLSDYGMTKISLNDKSLFEQYLLRSSQLLSSHSFPAIFIWSSVLNMLWKEIEGALCVFAGNDRDYFLLLPPISDGFNGKAVKESLEILSEINEGGAATRIENIPEEFYSEAASFGLILKRMSQEYIYSQKDLANLKGDRFKSKRALANHFEKNYNFNYRPIEKKDIYDCLDLYREWASRRLDDIKDDYCRLLIEDTYFALKSALMNLEDLEVEGQVAKVDGRIRGYTLGCHLNREMFVILFETVDLNMKGLSQFIFRQFSRSLKGYKYINSLSDSGLENLKVVKDSYHPIRKIPAFTAHP